MLSLSRGFLVAGKWRGAPVRVHWSLPVGALVFTGGGLRPGAWIGFVLLILAHELGHALLVRRQPGLKVLNIDLHGMGGECRYSGERVTRRARAVIAWGGVLAQAALLGVAIGLRSLLPNTPSLVDQLLYTFIYPNILMMGLNLLPIAPLDGAEAWKLLRLRRAPAGTPRPSPAEVDEMRTDLAGQLDRIRRESRDVKKKTTTK